MLTGYDQRESKIIFSITMLGMNSSDKVKSLLHMAVIMPQTEFFWCISGQNKSGVSSSICDGKKARFHWVVLAVGEFCITGNEQGLSELLEALPRAKAPISISAQYLKCRYWKYLCDSLPFI